MAIVIILFLLAIPIEMICLTADSDVAGGIALVALIVLGAIIGLIAKFFAPSLQASSAQYKKDVETIIILSCEKTSGMDHA